MQQITLQATPNQAFTLVLGDITYRLRVYSLGDGSSMACDISMDTVTISQGIRCIHGSFLLPFPSMEQENGNFMFFDDSAGDVWWENFGSTCRLYYVTNDELVAGR